MRLPKLKGVKINPLIILVISLLGAGLSQESLYWAEARRQALDEARAGHVAALTATRTQLAGLMKGVTSDKVLAQNLGWRLSHSAKAALSSKLEKGGLDGLLLVDRNCRELGRASLGGNAPSCPFKNTAPRPDRFAWLADKDGKPPLLTLVSRMAEVRGEELYAVGQVQLSADWLSLHPRLRHHVRTLDLTIGATSAEPQGAIIVAEGVENGVPLAALVSPSRLDGWLIRQPVGTGVRANRLLWPCLILAALAAFAWWWRTRQEWRAAATHLADFSNWCRSLTPLGDTVTVEPVVGAHNQVSLSQAQQFVSQALQVKIEAMRGLTVKRHALEDSVKARDAEIQNLERRLSELAELDSLATQLMRTTGSFLTRMQEFHSRAEDVCDVVGGRLAEQSQILEKMIADWQQGIAERGSRKFIRTLAETPGEGAALHDGTASGDQSGSTLLDDELKRLGALARDIADLAVGAAVDGHALVEDAAFAQQIAAFWHGLAMRSDDEAVCSSLFDPIDDAQQLVKLEAPHAALPFANLLTDDEATLIPPVAKPVWASALYHVYLCMAEMAEESGATIATRMRVTDDRVLLVVSLALGQSAHQKRRSDREPHHLEVARSILAPFDISLAVLPTLDGPFPVALSWNIDALTAQAAAALKLLPAKRRALPPSPIVRETSTERTSSEPSQYS
jgi:hypothetical protein